MDDVDAALNGLTESELAELNELVDPEQTLLPAGERQRSNTTKAPSGPFDRSHLMDHMKTEAERSSVGSDWLTYDGAKKGKAYKAPEKAPKGSMARKASADFMSTGDPELDALLCQVNDTDMVELAEAMDVHGMTTQHHSSMSAVGLGKREDGLKPVKAAVPVYTKDETDTSPQETDIEESLRLLSTNDVGLVKLNLNNHQEVTSEHLTDVCRAMLTNDHLASLLLVNTGFSDSHAKLLGDSLEYNRCLRVLNLESNKLTGVGARRIIAALKDNTTLEEIRLNNQVSMLGNQAESELADMLEHNRTLRKVGYSFKSPGARARIDRLLLRNNDLARQQRVSNSRVSYS